MSIAFLFFADGRIVEIGTYAELSRRGGVLSELARCAEPETVLYTEH